MYPEKTASLLSFLPVTSFFPPASGKRGLHPQLTQFSESQGRKKQWQQLLDSQASNPQVFVYPINYLHSFSNSQSAPGPSLRTSGLPLWFGTISVASFYKITVVSLWTPHPQCTLLKPCRVQASFSQVGTLRLGKRAWLTESCMACLGGHPGWSPGSDSSFRLF